MPALHRLILLLIAGLLFPWLLAAQPGELRFGHMDESNAPGGADEIGEDSLGFLWFATEDGLIRSDGYDYKYYQHKISDTTTISSNVINGFHCLPDHNLWVATKNGLNYFDRRRGTFTRFHHDENNPNSISDNNVTCVFVDKGGIVWAGTKTGGLNRYDPLSRKFTVYRADENNPDALSNDEVKDIVEDHLGNLWVATDGGGIDILDRSTGKFSHLVSDEQNHSTISGDYINDLHLDAKGNLWVAVSGAGVNRINVATREITRYYSNPADRNSLASNEALCVTHDSRGRIWIGFWSKGISILDPASGVVLSHRNHPDLSTSISSDIVTALYEDSYGIMRIGSGGIDYYDPENERFTLYQHNPSNINSVARNDIKSIYEESPDRLWIGTYNGGLSIYTRSSNSFRHYAHDPEKPNGLPNNGIWDILHDSKGRFWLCTSRGLCLFDTVTGNCKVYRDLEDGSNGMSAHNIIIAKEDRDGKLWLGTWYGGVNLFNPETETAVAYMHDDEDSASISNNNVKSILVDSKGRVWVGTNYGLNLFDRSTGKFTHYFNNPDDTTSLPENTVNVIIEDSRGKLWVGTGGGVALFNPEEGTFRRFSEENGLGSNVIVGVVEDDEGYLWISHPKGIDRFDTEKLIFTHHGDFDGAQNSYNTWAYDKGKSSHLYFGGMTGLTEFNPRDIVPNTRPPKLVFTGFYLFNQEVPVSDSTPLKQCVELTREITLTHEDYVFAFRFAALNYRQTERCQYAYKLEGFNDDWIYTDATNRLATFTNVPHGEYTLRVIASNEDGTWNNEGITMRITILPPWWLTWWAKTLWVLLIAGSAIGFYLFRVNALKRQKRTLEQQVALRTAQVVRQKEEITREKEKSDTLLLNILPKETAEELKETGSSLPRHYDQVTILFSDFTGFTKISAEMAPTNLVVELEEYFTAFDEIIDRYNIEKIKTIGDAYMCAGGIPVPNNTNAVDAVRAAIEMLRWVKERNDLRKMEGKPVWNIRIGIHTGPLVAGVIGKKKFAYDVWGDSVNVASRLESASEPGRINISLETYELVKHEFRCTPRGEIEIRNRGAIPMYYVVPPDL